MLTKNSSYNFRAGVFFPWLLLFTLISTLALTWWQLDSHEIIQTLKFVKFLSAKNYLAAGLTLWTFSILAFRIWFACRYRPYPPLPDNALPAITIIIPAYNEGRQILDTVRSVMNSRYPAKKNAGDLC